MRHYQFHIGDYEAATAHLTWHEDLAYRRLLQVYYRDESPLPRDINSVFRIVRAKSAPEKKAVAAVLDEFFTLTEDGWRNGRADKEIERFQGKSNKARESANARWSQCERIPNPDANAMLPNNHEPITNNHEPKKTPLPPLAAETIYEAYPRHEGKGKALQAIRTALGKVSFEVLLAAVQEFAASPKGKSGQFCPQPATWFNQERWTDDRTEWQRGSGAGTGKIGIGAGQRYQSDSGQFPGASGW